MNRDGRRFIREDRLVFVMLTALFLAVTALSVFLLAGERRRNTLLMEYDTEKLAAALLESYREGGLAELASVSRVRGFGVYDAEGSSLVREGDAPARLRVPPAAATPAGRLPQPRFTLNRQQGTLTMIRLLGVPGLGGMHGRMPGSGAPGPGPGRLPGGMQGMMGRMYSAGPALLFLQISVEPFYARQRVLTVAQVLVPLLILGALVSVALLYRRNQLYRRRLAVQEQLARLGEASRTLSHEIKNPLSAIRIQTGLLRKTLPPEQHGELQVIEEEVGRLRLLSDRVGDFLRDPRGQAEVLDLDRFLRELVPRFEGPVRYEKSASGEVPVRFDPGRLRSVVENLVNNALESAPGAAVEVQLENGRREVTLRVLDRGPGVAEEIRDKVFDPFFTSKIQGSGVGLAIARRFVEGAGGRLFLQPRSGGGTEARVELPREES